MSPQNSFVLGIVKVRRSTRTIKFALLAIGLISAFAFATATPVDAQYYLWPPPPLPGPPYPYQPNYPYTSGPGYYACPGGYITLRGDICEPYFPLSSGKVR